MNLQASDNNESLLLFSLLPIEGDVFIPIGQWASSWLLLTSSDKIQ